MARYVVNTDAQQIEMLKTLGVGSIEDLLSPIPKEVRYEGEMNLPQALSELELKKHLTEISNKNENTEKLTCFLGAGAYDHYIPSAVDQLLSRQEFYTAYTPYQPEISQGTLQAIFEYQSMICELTGMDAANASIYDGATALAEAAVMACKISRRKEILLASTAHPEKRRVLNTYARFQGIEIKEIAYQEGTTSLTRLEELISEKTAAVIIENPNFFGCIEPVRKVTEICANNKVLSIVSVDPISLGILEAPGEMGVDIVVGEGQSLGNPLSFGGPYLGFFAVRKQYLRQMPGRIVGETVDKAGKRAFCLTMQTREQHIRREKATSNICSNQALNALAATIYLTLLGKEGLRETAKLCLQKAHYTQKQLITKAGFEAKFTAPFFKEFVLQSPIPITELNSRLLKEGILGGYQLEKDYPELKNCWLVAVTENRSRAEIDQLVRKAGIINEK